VIVPPMQNPSLAAALPRSCSCSSCTRRAIYLCDVLADILALVEGYLLWQQSLFLSPLFSLSLFPFLSRPNFSDERLPCYRLDTRSAPLDRVRSFDFAVQSDMYDH